MKKLLFAILFTLVLSEGAKAGFILEGCENIDTGKKFKNKIFIVSDGAKKILEIDKNKFEVTNLTMFDLDSYYSGQAQGFSENENIRILLDSNEKIVEIKYSSGGTYTYSCSKLK